MSHLKEDIKRAIFALLFGFPLTVWLLLRNRRTVYYIPHIGLGDYCIALGYLEEYKRRHHIGHITLIVPPNRKEAAQFYPYWDSLLVIKSPLYLGLVCFGGIPVGRVIHRKIARIRNINYNIRLKGSAYCNSSVGVDDVIKKILDLPNTSERKAPHVPQTDISHLAERYDISCGNTVLLNPYTSGMAVEEIDVHFYVVLAEALKEAGFSVVTVLGSGKQAAVSGTEGVVTSLAEAWRLAQWCGYVIGTRSGFFDFIRLSDCNMIGIYDASYKLKDFFSLHLPSEDQRVLELVWTSDSAKEMIEKICSICLEWRLSEEQQ